MAAFPQRVEMMIKTAEGDHREVLDVAVVGSRNDSKAARRKKRRKRAHEIAGRRAMLDDLQADDDGKSAESTCQIVRRRANFEVKSIGRMFIGDRDPRYRGIDAGH